MEIRYLQETIIHPKDEAHYPLGNGDHEIHLSIGETSSALHFRKETQNYLGQKKKQVGHIVGSVVLLN